LAPQPNYLAIFFSATVGQEGNLNEIRKTNSFIAIYISLSALLAGCILTANASIAKRLPDTGAASLKNYCLISLFADLNLSVAVD
jgi:hypothetical protein